MARSEPTRDVRLRRGAAVALAAALGGLVAAGCASSSQAPGGGAATPKPVALPSGEIDRAALAADVRAELAFAWQAYRRYAWGQDEVNPLSRTAHNWYAEPVLMTPVDALDTLLLAGLKDEAESAKGLILERLSFDKDLSVQTFEIVIRLLGGLITAHQMTGDPRLLALADDLGKRLLPMFDSPTGMPYRFVNLRTGKTADPQSNPAEIGTLLLEFGTLARLTGKAVYYDKAKNALVQVYKRRSPLGLVGTVINVETGQWSDTTSQVGARIDSYYEYLLKCARLFGDAECEAMWRDSVQAINRHLADEVRGELWYGEADMNTGKRTATHYGALHAFLPAVLALGGDLERARRLQASGFKMWTHAGIEPEVFDYARERIVADGYPLRPEIIESAYYLYHYTRDPAYQQMGKLFFDSLKAHCRTDAGYTTLDSVVAKRKGDRMHSFFFAETLKYLYLLAAPETLDLGSVVYNTEAHPIKRSW